MVAAGGLFRLEPSRSKKAPGDGPQPQLQLLRRPKKLADVRVAARNFSPRINAAKRVPPLLLVRELFLPDNTHPQGIPVFFEGNLKWFRRQIGVVIVCLDAPKFPDGACDGFVPFRGKLGAIVRGPTIVELDFPFLIERLPADSENYWRDLRLPRVQLKLPMAGSRQD